MGKIGRRRSSDTSSMHVTRYLAPVLILALTSGCGLGETAATATAVAESEAQAAKAATETKARIEQGIQDAQEAAAEQRRAIDEATE
jgi:hypothetical protein